MFSLLYGLWEYVSRKEELRVLIIGLDKSGKTTLLEKIKGLFGDTPGLEPHAILPTVGLNVGRLEAFQAQLLLWDLGGAPGLRSIWDKYYADSHALLFVVDASQPARLEEARCELERALASRELFGAPLLVLANKTDLAPEGGAGSSARLGLERLEGRASRVQPASALSGAGVREGLQWLVEQVRRSDRAALLQQRATRA
ncbi:hypothetical protein WJX81_006203 [Elliptochloris bilobata]|uniref:ADP-ribosylation factor-related protein 1 n=1 Tax=Elliptochloris bilobata TaxID=381761 RepID=A0AAW1S1E6_9CHLO